MPALATDNIITRDATAGDYGAFARLFPELGVPDPVPSADYFATAIMPQAIVATLGDDVVGYGWGRARASSFHVVHVIGDPMVRRRGVGRAVMNGLAARARAQGFSRWLLNVKPDNHAARALYEQCGMRPQFESASLRVTWADAAKIASDGAVTRALSSVDDDAPFELALAMSLGELAAFRVLGRPIIGALVDGAPMGAAAFDAHLPGLAPCRVKTPRVVRALLDAARPLVTGDHIFVFAENDPALEQALVDVGATTRLRVLRMEGPVPS